MKENYTKIILIIFLILVAITYFQFSTDVTNKDYTEAEAGYMNLSGQNLKDRIIDLDGEWEFYPDTYNINDFNKKEYVRVPDRWNNFNNGGKLMSAYGIGTYHLRLKLPAEGLYCFNIKFISSAYKLFINQTEIASNGTVKTPAGAEIATWEPRIIAYYAKSKDMDIVIQVSNYNHNKGGIINSILFGYYSNVYNNNLQNIIKSAAIIGIFAGLGIYLILIYRTGRKKYIYLYLGLFCISSFVLESILDVSIIYHIWGNITFSQISKLQYSAYIGENIAIQLFLNAIFPEEMNRHRYLFLHFINFTYLVLIILTPISIFGYSDMIYMFILIFNFINALFTLLKAIYNKRKFAGFLMAGFLIMVFTICIDVLYANNYTKIYSTSSNYVLGLLFFLICQIYVSSIDIVYAFHSSARAKDMEIAFLQAQIAPHFFFNTLNNIYCLMDQSVPKARSLILDFCNFLRVKHKFDYRENIYYTLKEELDLVKSFVKIENARLQEVIHLETDISEEFMGVSIPQLLIQPIVENSIKHGFYQDTLNIMIIALYHNNKLEVVVSDNGKGMGKELTARILENKDSPSGVGLKNVNYRLMKCYGSKLKIESEISIGTKISFEIPIQG
ncbi:MAG: histidine kinase [Anaerocolumna sp.]